MDRLSAFQIRSALDELGKISSKLDDTEGKKKDFYVENLLRFKDRLTVLAKPENLEQAATLSDLLEELRDVLHQL